MCILKTCLHSYLSCSRVTVAIRFVAHCTTVNGRRPANEIAFSRFTSIRRSIIYRGSILTSLFLSATFVFVNVIVCNAGNDFELRQMTIYKRAHSRFPKCKRRWNEMRKATNSLPAVKHHAHRHMLCSINSANAQQWQTAKQLVKRETNKMPLNLNNTCTVILYSQI